MKKISIAVCLKNEQASIISCLESLSEAISYASNKYDFDLYICFNGTTDNSKELVEAWSLRQLNLKPKIIILEKGNLIEAQRAVIKEAKKDCIFFGFFDADIIVNKETILLLIEKLELESSCIVVYAKSYPIRRKRETLTEKVMNLYDSGPSIYSERKHLHGRAFITKDWLIPETNYILSVDDIYLSFYYLTKYGVDSIKIVPSAKIMFRQIRTFIDYFNVYRRRNMEIKKCLSLFPEFLKLPKDQINRCFIWKKFWKTSLCNKVLWSVFFLYKFIARIRLKIENFWFSGKIEQWQSSTTSKRTRIEPLLILIEGLDCSGKKTLARSLHQKFTSLGISSELNFGPLGPSWYRKLSQIVSVNKFPNLIRTIVYSFEIAIGSRRAQKYQSDIVIQISSILRSFAYTSITNNKIRYLIYKIFSKRIPDYKFAVYLTTSYNNRKSRHKMQLALGENSDNIESRFKDEIFFERFETKLLELMKKQFGNYTVFNTEDKLSEEISEEIIGKIKDLLLI